MQIYMDLIYIMQAEAGNWRYLKESILMRSLFKRFVGNRIQQERIREYENKQ